MAGYTLYPPYGQRKLVLGELVVAIGPSGTFFKKGTQTFSCAALVMHQLPDIPLCTSRLPLSVHSSSDSLARRILYLTLLELALSLHAVNPRAMERNDLDLNWWAA